MKACSKCKVEKPFSEFYKKTRYKDYSTSPAGYSSDCKECIKAKQRLWNKNCSKELRNQVSKKWRKRNPDKVKQSCQANNANRRANYKVLTRKDIAYILTEGQYSCVYCSSSGNTIDHLVPVSKGGSNNYSNLVVACKSCNSSKRDKPLLNFLWTSKVEVN